MYKHQSITVPTYIMDIICYIKDDEAKYEFNTNFEDFKENARCFSDITWTLTEDNDDYKWMAECSFMTGCPDHPLTEEDMIRYVEEFGGEIVVAL